MWQQFFLQKFRIVSPKVKAQGVLPYKSDGVLVRKFWEQMCLKFISTPEKYQFNNNKLCNWHYKF